MSAAPIEYARSGDVHVAYQVVGDGPIDLVMAMGTFTNLEVLWERAEYRRLCERLGSFARKRKTSSGRLACSEQCCAEGG